MPQRAIHPIFADFCGIERTLEKAECIQAFVIIEPQGDGKPFVMCEDGQVVWHPNFKGNVVDPVNAQFIEAVVKKVLENEQVYPNPI